MIVAELPYNVTDRTIDSQIVDLTDLRHFGDLNERRLNAALTISVCGGDCSRKARRECC